MKAFSKILEVKEINYNKFCMTKEELDAYVNAIKKTKRSQDFQLLLWKIAQIDELLEKEKLQDILNGKFNTTLTVSLIDAKDIYKLAKKVGAEVKLLPQLLSTAQREAVVNKKINVEDLMLDLESDKGRNETAKKYMPLVHKIVNQYIGKSSLSRDDLFAAGSEGLVNAMNEYKNPEELEKIGKSGNMSFAQYAAYRIKQQILDDIENNSRNVKISNYYQSQLKANDETVNREFSIDRVMGDDEDPINVDRFLGISEEDPYIEQREKEEIYNALAKYLEKKFSSRDCNIFYRVNGIMGFNKEKVKDLAKEFGISSPAIVQLCKRIAKFIANDSYCRSLKNAFESLVEDYITNKLLEVYAEDRNKIIESFLYDDYYIVLEELNKWHNKNDFQRIINKATDMLCVEDALLIYDILRNTTQLNSLTVKKHKGAIIEFLKNVFPERAYQNANTDALLDTMEDLKTQALTFQIAW